MSIRTFFDSNTIESLQYWCSDPLITIFAFTLSQRDCPHDSQPLLTPFPLFAFASTNAKHSMTSLIPRSHWQNS